ncbi:MAG: aldolase catalytic domain-containing protein [Eggerthellaceae bacterium]|nr:aldolase catalytic domain-containing protein [Eggerthellaceae bacterium]
MKISVLDCTLRDGGYVNDFRFGVNRIQTIQEKLCDTNIEMLECGFLRTGKKDPNLSLYGGVEQIKLPKDREGKMFLAMIEYGGISVEEIVPRQPDFIDGIRLSFHNSEWEKTKQAALNLMEKGYKVFIQPIGTVSYTDEELLALIKEVNTLKPFAFYLVDTLGSMYKNDLLRMFFLVENNLEKDICLGFHSHNNLQLSFANAMILLELHTDRHIIIDSSAFGMGRGAGNLNTELITHFINSNIEKRYNLVPLLELIDDIILPIYKYDTWGFSEPYYLSAIMGVHPNYASYLIEKQSIGMTKIFELLDSLPKADKHLFKKQNIEDIYHAEMSHNVEDEKAVKELAAKLDERDVLILAPGNSVARQIGCITEHIENTNPFVISINFIPEGITPDLVFVSNRKRFEHLAQEGFPIVVTSNITSKGMKGVYVINYDSLLQENIDSSGAMALRFLMRLGVKHAALAGYDGFTGGEDHYSDSLDNYLATETVTALNSIMSKQLSEIGKAVSLKFITPSVYEVN